MNKLAVVLFLMLNIFCQFSQAWQDRSCYQTSDCGDALKWTCAQNKCVRISTPYVCSSQNKWGEYADGGGCNEWGCWIPGGGCNTWGCWEQGGGCSTWGCWFDGGGCSTWGCWRGGGKCDTNGCVRPDKAPKDPFKCSHQ